MNSLRTKSAALRTFAAGLLLWTAAAGDAMAERHALLVGVSQYPAFAADDKMQLSGPKNDVELIRTLLLGRGFAPESVQVLADGVAQAQLPTRIAILSALDTLVAKAKSGDFVFLYFAGHGSQMPANLDTPEGRAESDGLHELFLPRDVGKWNGSAGKVDNAIVDFELNRRLDGLLAKEAFVWAIFDACHSATLMRSADDPDIRYRHVGPKALGISPELIDIAKARARTAARPEADSPGPGRVGNSRSRSGAGAGGFVAFYAAQTTQTTPEMRLPLGGSDRKPYGLFGYTLAEALSSLDGVTYRQLAQYVMQRYNAQNFSTPTPLFTGTHQDSPVFGNQLGQAVRQWPIERSSKGHTVRAGLLSQLEPGTVLAVLPSAIAKNSEALGTARVELADVLTSTLVSVAEPNKPALNLATLPKGAVARLVQATQPAFKLRVQPPAAGTSAAHEEARKAIESIQRAGRNGVEVAWVKPGDPYDLRLQIADGQLWLVPPTGQFYVDGPHKTHSIRIQQPDFESKLAQSFQHIGRAQNLLRLAAVLQQPADNPASTVEVSLARAILPEGKPGEASAADCNVPRKPAQRIDLSQTPDVGECDLLEVKVTNPGRTAIDFTALYVDAAYGVGALFPVGGASNRIEAGKSETISIKLNVETTGLERMLLIAVEARRQTERNDFTFLTQAQLERTRAGVGDLEAVFMEAGFGPPRGQGTRGQTLVPSPERTDMRVLSVRVR